MQHTTDNQCAPNRFRAFTLVELLIVVVILGILATVVIPMFTDAATDAKSTMLKSLLKGIRSAMERYKIDHGEYPITGIADQTLPYPTDQGGKREGMSGYVGPIVGGPYLRGPRTQNTLDEETLVLPNNPFWNDPNDDHAYRTFYSGSEGKHANPRQVYNLIGPGYVSLDTPIRPGPQFFHANWGPPADCSEGSEDPDCAFDW